MKLAFLTNIVSPHRLPVARELVNVVGADNYQYIYTDPLHQERAEMGWQTEVDYSWCRQGAPLDSELLEADLTLVGAVRACDLFEARLARGRPTWFSAERCFKPPFGMLRLLSPRFFKMAWRLCRCLKSEHFVLFPIGIHAARDYARLMGLFNGDWRCLFRAPRVTFETKPGGQIWVEGKLAPNMKMWGYFVEPSPNHFNHTDLASTHAVAKTGKRILWVGRMLKCKRVETLIKAVKGRRDVSLSVYGHGPEEKKLLRLAQGTNNIFFHDFVSMQEVRELMRQHDVYVLPSDGYEGWGAVVSEALEEGMKVLGTSEAGASATLLPETNLFHAGDVKRLRVLLQGDIQSVAIGPWTVQGAAQWIVEHLP